MARIVDVVLWLDGLLLDDEDSVDRIVEAIQTTIRQKHHLHYDIKYEVQYEEEVVDD